MTTYRNPLDGTPGTAVTAGNGGGDPWSTVVGGAMVYLSSPVWSGPAAAVGSADTTGYLLRQVAQPGRVRAVGYVRIPAPISQTADVSLVRAYYAANVSAGVQLVGASGATPRLVLQTRGSGSYTDRWTSGTIPWDTWVRVELDIDPGASPTTGAARLRWYLGDDATPQGDSTLITGIDTAGTEGRLQDVRHGTVAGVVIDHVGVRAGTDALDDAPWPSNVPPSLTLSAAQTTAAGDGWTVTALATDDGAISSYAWAVQRLDSTGTTEVTTGLAGQGAATLTGDTTTTTAGSVLLVTCTVTDDGALTAAATTEVRVPAPSPVGPLGTDGTGDPGWTVVGDAPSTGVALADGDPATKAMSPEVDPGGSTARTWRVAPMTQRQTLRLTAGGVATTAPLTGTVTVALLRGTTILATQTTAVTTPGDVVLDLPDAMTTIGSTPDAWSDLSVRVTVRSDA